jgi:hypothetical protein
MQFQLQQLEREKTKAEIEIAYVEHRIIQLQADEPEPVGDIPMDREPTK